MARWLGLKLFSDLAVSCPIDFVLRRLHYRFHKTCQLPAETHTRMLMQASRFSNRQLRCAAGNATYRSKRRSVLSRSAGNDSEVIIDNHSLTSTLR